MLCFDLPGLLHYFLLVITSVRARADVKALLCSGSALPDELSLRSPFCLNLPGFFDDLLADNDAQSTLLRILVGDFEVELLPEGRPPERSLDCRARDMRLTQVKQLEDWESS